MAESFACDAREMTALAKDLVAADKAARSALYASLEVAGEIIAAKAAQNASRFSKKIPPSLRVLRRGTSVKILAGGEGAGNAGPLEHGGVPGSFRHPVFGRDVWVSQPAHPFLVPAAHETEAAVVAVVNRAVETALSRLGF